MFKTPLPKVLLIIFLTVFSIYINLPGSFTLDLTRYKINFNKTLSKPDLKIGRFNLGKKNELILGLDLQGGSRLVFEADTVNIDSSVSGDALTGTKDIIEKRVNLFGVSEPNVQLSEFEGKKRIVVELPGIKDIKEAIKIIGTTAQLNFAEVSEEEDKGLIPTDLTGADLVKSQVQFDQKTSKPVVAIEFNEAGGSKFEKLTEKNIGKPLVILLDNNIISYPTVQDKISGGSAVITGDFTLDEAKNLAIQLNAGALPVPITLVEQRTVGAALGTESVQKSVNAGVVGLVMVMLFMILSYGRMGFVADLALLIFGTITLSLYKLIPVVLTLPGIAGFLLSVGMAVDSNILIFERFKEEIIKRPFTDALEISFGKAWDSIRDANIATLSTAFILANPFEWNFLHTSGPVRGFAITLALGILISLFTGIVVTRNLLRVLIRKSGRVKE
ncbi:MAG TPA: protein translocase subunit SecD [Patescibacteria group bacterium]|nr:protein translocase subunit SecD [Patescibacteria group bacterium]